MRCENMIHWDKRESLTLNNILQPNISMYSIQPKDTENKATLNLKVAKPKYYLIYLAMTSIYLMPPISSLFFHFEWSFANIVKKKKKININI